MPEHPTHSHGPFPVTNWPLVAAAGEGNTLARGKALDTLLRQYLPALKAYAIAKFGVDGTAADDWLQDFVLHKVVTRKLFGQVQKERGRFRVFLMTAFNNFVLSELRKAKAQKRQPSHAVLCLDQLAEKELLGPDRQSQAQFDLIFARQVFLEAACRMKAECDALHRFDLWTVFEKRVLAPLRDDLTPASVDELMRELGFESAAQVSNALATGKRMYARCFRSVVAEFTLDASQVEQEVRELKDILAGA